MRIKIEKIVYPGKSLGRGADGIATFTEGALPGEVVEVRITRNKKTYKEGKLVQVIEPSSLRVPAQCPSFGICGGCSFQYVRYDTQLKLKEESVKELLAPFGAEIAPIVRSPEEQEYRNKMEFSFFQGRDLLSAGLHEKGEFDRYLPVPPCQIAGREIVAILEAVVSFARRTGLAPYHKRARTGFYRHLVIRKAKRTGEILVNLVTNANADISREFFMPLIRELEGKAASLYWTINSKPSDAVIADELILLAGKDHITEELQVKGVTYSFFISPFSFFQTNTLATEKLYETVIDTLHPSGDDVVLDLYCGTGTIGTTLARYVKAVLGVEQVVPAIENAQQNSKLNGIDNISFEAGSVEQWIKSGKTTEYSTLVLDPPRGGISNKVVDFIARTLPEKIGYVSCNPSTLARDLKEILASGHYRVTAMVPVDMFPQTYHIEVVTALQKT